MEELSLWEIIEQSIKALMTENGTIVSLLMLVVLGLIFSIRQLNKSSRQKDEHSNQRLDKLTDKLVTVIENNTKVLTELVSHINQRR